jgi:hypothetical protein
LIIRARSNHFHQKNNINQVFYLIKTYENTQELPEALLQNEQKNGFQKWVTLFCCLLAKKICKYDSCRVEPDLIRVGKSLT